MCLSDLNQAWPKLIIITQQTNKTHNKSNTKMQKNKSFFAKRSSRKRKALKGESRGGVKD